MALCGYKVERSPFCDVGVTVSMKRFRFFFVHILLFNYQVFISYEVCRLGAHSSRASSQSQDAGMSPAEKLLKMPDGGRSTMLCIKLAQRECCEVYMYVVQDGATQN